MKTHENPGRLVADLRKLIGKSQAQFAIMIGVSKHTIISVENGRNKLSRSLAKKIEVATGADLFERKLASPFKVSNYTMADFTRWHETFSRCNETAALKQFDEMKKWLKVILLAAAKPSRDDNSHRFPAVCLSFREWLDETRKHFKLEEEFENLIEDNTREVRRVAFSIEHFLANPAEAKKDLGAHNIDFNSIKRQLMNAPRGWLIVEDEFRDVWTSSGIPYHVLCGTRKLLPRPKCWIKNFPPPPPDMREFEDLIKFNNEQLAELHTLIEGQDSRELLVIPRKTNRPLS